MYKLKQAVNLLTVRLKELGLSLEPKKSRVLVEYSKQRYWDRNIHIRIDIKVYDEKEIEFLN